LRLSFRCVVHFFSGSALPQLLLLSELRVHFKLFRFYVMHLCPPSFHAGWLLQISFAVAKNEFDSSPCDGSFCDGSLVFCRVLCAEIPHRFLKTQLPGCQCLQPVAVFSTWT
jgi:hypothetical protein